MYAILSEDQFRMADGGDVLDRPGVEMIARVDAAVLDSPEELKEAMATIFAEYKREFARQVDPNIDKIAFMDCKGLGYGRNGRIFEAVYRVTYKPRLVSNESKYVALKLRVDDDGTVFMGEHGGYSTHKPEWYDENKERES